MEVQISFQRQRTAAQRDADLAAMNAARLSRDPSVVDSLAGTLKVPGVTVNANPFPEWARADLEGFGYEFEDLNFYYFKRFAQEDGAKAKDELQKMTKWRERSADRDWVHWIVVRLMHDHADLAELEAF